MNNDVYAKFMDDYSLSAVHGVNKYLWQVMRDNNVVDEADYGSYVPIIPTQQVPEFNDMLKATGKESVPYIVYTYRVNPVVEYSQVESIAYIIYSQDQNDLIKIANLMVDHFKRADEGGQRIQEYLDTLNHPVLSQYDIKYTLVESAGGPDPQREENGRMTSIVAIRVAYTVD